MASRQILLVSKFADLWGKNFDRKVDELDCQIGKIDLKKTIENATEVHNAESVEIIPLAMYKTKPHIIYPFSFLTVKN